MTIEELKVGKYITVTLSYDEVKDIANGLYRLTSKTSIEAESGESMEKYEKAYSNSKILFDIVKHGNVMPETVKFRYEKILKESECVPHEERKEKEGGKQDFQQGRI